MLTVGAHEAPRGIPGALPAGPARRDAETEAALDAAMRRLTRLAVRSGLGLLVIAAIADGGLSLTAGAEATTIAISSAIGVAALTGACLPARAERLICRGERICAAAAGFALLSLPPLGVHPRLDGLEVALACLAALVAPPAWMAACVALLAAGIVGHDLASGQTLGRMLAGRSREELCTQLAAMSLGGAFAAAVMATMRRTLEMAGPEASHAEQHDAAAPTGAPADSPAVAVLGTLTPAERRVLELLVRGLAPKQAAVELGVTLPTIRTQIASARRKTHARTIEQLVALFAEADGAP